MPYHLATKTELVNTDLIAHRENTGLFSCQTLVIFSLMNQYVTLCFMCSYSKAHHSFLVLESTSALFLGGNFKL